MRRRDDDRAAGVDDVGDELLAVGRRGAGRADVLQDIDAGVERVPDVLLGVDVGVDLDPVTVRGADDRLVVLERSGRRAP